MAITITNIPDKKKNTEADFKIEKLVEDRNKSICKLFNMEPLDVEVKLYHSTHGVKYVLDPNGDQLGVFAGYVEPEKTIHLTHPEAVGPIFGDNLDKQLSILVDYSLIKMYLCQKYYPNREQFKTYYKHLSEGIAQISAGNFREESIKFDIKMYVDGKKYRKDQEVFIVLYIMYKNSGVKYIFEHLDKIMEECDIVKTMFSIYKKGLSDFLPQMKNEVMEEEKKLRELERARRQAQRDKAINSSN